MRYDNSRFATGVGPPEIGTRMPKPGVKRRGSMTSLVSTTCQIRVGGCLVIVKIAAEDGML